MSDLPNRIREHRKARGWGLEKLAGLVGCSAVQISDLERGERGLTDHWMRRIATALEVQPADLLLEADNSESLSVDERELLLRFRSATPEQQAQIKTIIQTIAPANGNGKAA